MMTRNYTRSIALLDSDIRRRADICHKLQPFNVRIEPFDCLEEMTSYTAYDAVLAADCGPGIPEIIDTLEDRGCRLPVIAFSSSVDVKKIVTAIRVGAANYLDWPCDPALVVDALAALQPIVVTPKQNAREGAAKDRMRLLTPREKDILRGMANGLSSKKLGESLSIGTRTVETHRRNLILKLGARNSVEAIRIALEGQPGLHA